MTFSRVKTPDWVSGETITPAQINGIDSNQAKAIDGDAGGTYTPSGLLNVDNLGNMEWADGYLPQCTTRTEWRIVPLAWSIGTSLPIDTYWESDNFRMKQIAQYSIVTVDAPKVIGATLKNIRACWIGSAHGSLPSDMPVVTAYKINGSTGGYSTIGTITDGSPTTGQYTLIHVLTFAVDVSTTFDDDDRFIIQFRGEGGTNYANDGLLVYLQAKWEFTELHPG